MAQILKPNRKDNRGGHENCGRKKGNTKGFTIRCKPENIGVVRKFINENQL
jgi:hypothetical protein